MFLIVLCWNTKFYVPGFWCKHCHLWKPDLYPKENLQIVQVCNIGSKGKARQKCRWNTNNTVIQLIPLLPQQILRDIFVTVLQNILPNSYGQWLCCGWVWGVWWVLKGNRQKLLHEGTCTWCLIPGTRTVLLSQSRDATSGFCTGWMKLANLVFCCCMYSTSTFQDCQAIILTTLM